MPFDVQTHFAWIRTRLAGERTLMSWERISLTLTGFGFTLYESFKGRHEARIGAALIRPEASSSLALVMVLTGAAGTLVALWQYLAAVRYLHGDEFAGLEERQELPHWALPLFLGLFLLLIGVTTALWIALGG